MDVPSRSEAIEIIRSSRARLEALIAALSDDETAAPATLGGGDWSIKDLLGHLASWEERALPWLESSDAADTRSFAPTDEFNAAEVEKKAGWSLSDVRDESARVHQRLLRSIEDLDDDTWLAEVPIPGHDPVARGFLVGMILAGDEHGAFAHDLAHLNDVDAYVKSRGSDGPQS